jgi:hypothetical protein
VVIAAALIILYVLFVRATRRIRRADPEEADFDDEGLRPGRIDLGLDRLAAWLKRLGRYGMGQQLLAAITVENIYANLTRLARRRGFPRAASEDPTRYLARLYLAFPDHRPELDAITAAYLVVHYAERPIQPDELARVRAAYEAVIAEPAEYSTAPR